MSDYIKRDDAIEAMENQFADIMRTHKRRVTTGEKAIASDMIETAKMVKSADVAPVRHAHWIKEEYWSEGVGMGEIYGYYYRCSNCGDSVQGGYRKCDDKYCRNCGARMDEEA